MFSVLHFMLQELNFTTSLTRPLLHIIGRMSYGKWNKMDNNRNRKESKIDGRDQQNCFPLYANGT